MKWDKAISQLYHSFSLVSKEVVYLVTHSTGSNTEMCQQNISTLIEIIARLFGAASHYLNQCWLIVSRTATNFGQEQISTKIQCKYEIFVVENGCENAVCEMVIILFRSQCVINATNITLLTLLRLECSEWTRGRAQYKDVVLQV